MRYKYMVVLFQGPFVMVRTPYPMPRWRAIMKALTTVVRSHGRLQKDIHMVEHVAGGEVENDEADASTYEKAEAAYKGGKQFAAFSLYDWRGGRFVLVREPVAKS